MRTAGGVEPVLLALLHARVARQEARALERPAEGGVEVAQGTRDAVTDRAGLADGPPAAHIDQHIVLAEGVGLFERLLDAVSCSVLTFRSFVLSTWLACT